VGENLALLSQSIATTERFVEMWMNSPGHRENLLTPAWDVTGVGVFTGRDGTVYATQLADQLVRRIEPGAFEIEHPLGSRGTLRVALGIPDTSSRYEVVHQFDAHPATGRLEEIY
jgi:hypothetical protein